MRQDARTDNNHAEIRQAVKSAGYFWTDTFQLGYGFPDALCLSKSGIPILVELKSENGRLTRREHEFHAGYSGPLEIWRTAEEALERLAEYDGMRIEVME